MKAVATLVLGAALASANVLPRQTAGSPMNLALISAAPAPSVSGPPVAAVMNTINYNAASASSTGSAAASATGTPSGSKVKRNWGYFNWCWTWGSWSWGYCPNGQNQPGSYPTPTPPATSTASASTCTTTPYTPYYPAVTTGTATQYRTPTVTSGSATACPTTPEAGTYCGFINPLDDCAPQPDGYGPVPTPDTASAFLAYPQFSQMATTAQTPAGYSKNFTNLQGSVQGAGYLALKTLQTYDPAGCAAYCDCTDTCTAFNLVIERDPNLNPAANCTNPPSMTSYKCYIFAEPITAADATNTGQWRSGFQVVITGSNGYNKLPSQPHQPTCPGWQPPSYCPGGAVWAPRKGMGSSFFPGPFDPRVCAAYAQSQSSKNQASCQRGQRYQSCNFFNAYAVQVNGSYAGFMCNLFTDAPGWGDGPSSGSYTGCNSNGVQYNALWSFSYQISQYNYNNGNNGYNGNGWNNGNNGWH